MYFFDVIYRFFFLEILCIEIGLGTSQRNNINFLWVAIQTFSTLAKNTEGPNFSTKYQPKFKLFEANLEVNKSN